MIEGLLILSYVSSCIHSRASTCLLLCQRQIKEPNKILAASKNNLDVLFTDENYYTLCILGIFINYQNP